MKKNSLLLFAVFSTIVSAAQPTGLWFDGADLYLATVNPLTGVKTNIAQVPLVTGIVSPTFTKNNNLGTYIFRGVDNSNTYYLTELDFTSGQVVNMPLMPDNVRELQYYCADSMIYGIWDDGMVENFVRLDPVTGMKTTIASLPTVSAYVGESSFIDPVNGIYYLGVLDNTSTYRFLGIQISNGTVVSNPVFANPNITGLEYRCADSTVYGIWWDGNALQYIKFNPVTATRTNIATVPGIFAISIGSQSLSNNGNLYYFTGIDQSSSLRLYELNALTGALLNSPYMAETVNGIMLDYGCCQPPPSGLNPDPTVLSFTIFPQPALDLIKISGDFLNENAAWKIMDVKGSKLMSGSHREKNANYFELDISGLNPGIYFLGISRPNGQSGQSKFIVVR